MNVAVEIDVNSGALVANLPNDFSSQLLTSYRPEIESYLTEEGKKSLRLPYDTGSVVIAYRDELAKISKEQVSQLVSERVNLSFKNPYGVPVFADTRFAFVACLYVDSPEIIKMRESMGLKPLYSEGKPLRLTFAAVHNPHLSISEDALLERVKNSKSLQDWMLFASSI